MEELSERDRAMLMFERAWWRIAGSKEQAIHDQFGMTPTAYYMRLNRLIESRAAVEFEPMVVKRLLRLRDQRRGVRAGRWAG